MARARWTEAARADLRAIVLYIGVNEGRRTTALKIAAEIRDKCRLYVRQPLLGQAYHDFGTRVRGFAFKRWLILYRPVDGGIEVLAAVDSARDVAALFSRNPLPTDPSEMSSAE